ncbi:Protein RTF2 [Phytophthora pseudosyringae]|uniref:Protein RTF2 n=1 Tax=Phytophthora pseudosyringae TaxID=221518 RepID=A0A8T1VJL4_9STRA|nr:Protein RTF2 [Phytophthora pseudosyringae]
MGNDGGVIAVKRKFMRHANVKARGEKADQEALRLEKARTCALSSEPLREPVVACRLGNLFNKQTLLEHLLVKSMPERFRHITSLKDVATCRVTREKEGAEDALWCCPVTMAEFNGKQPFVVLFSCGCVLSERALKAVNTKECLVCGNPFEEQDVEMLLLDDEQYETKQKQLLELKAEGKRVRKSKKRAKEEKEEKDGGKKEHKKHHKDKKSKRKAEQLGEMGDARLVKIAKDASESISKAKEKSQVFASLFSKEKQEKASANDLLMTIGGMRYTLS